MKGKCENPITEIEEKQTHRDAENEQGEFKVGFEQWLVDGDRFVPITKTVPELPSGDYGLRYDRTYDKHILVLRQPITETLLHLPMKEFDEVLADIRTFWKSRKEYDDYGYVYKRGILLYGPPGCGKSSLVMLITQELCKRQEGIVLNIATSDDIIVFDDIMKGIREIEPDRKIVAVIEDIDNFVNMQRGQNEIESKLLNILDGKMQFDNVVIIATTNYPEELEERISNRPSRFDLRREIGPPKMRARKFYLESKLKRRDLKKLDMELWLKETKGFTIDHLKELVMLVFVHKRKFEDALSEVRGMIKMPRLKNTPADGEKKLGFIPAKDEEDDDRIR